MLRRVLFVVMLSIFGAASIISISLSFGANKDVPARLHDPERLYNPDSDSYAEIVDVRKSYVQSPSEIEVYLKDNPPEPLGFGAGTTYNNGQLGIAAHAILFTKMFVYYDGAILSIVNPTGNDKWLYTTATNRTMDTIEAHGSYYDVGGAGKFVIFDWSVDTGTYTTGTDGNTYKCILNHISNTGNKPITGSSWRTYWAFENSGSNGNSWQASKLYRTYSLGPNGTTSKWQFADYFTNLPSAFFQSETDDGGHLRLTLRYSNETVRTNPSDPFAWQNNVFLWNFPENRWYWIYTHNFRSDQANITSGYGWWGPIIETDNSQNKTIKELGYKDSSLYDDTYWNNLDSSVTSWTSPPSNWTVFHRVPNRGWGVGNSY